MRKGAIDHLIEFLEEEAQRLEVRALRYDTIIPSLVSGFEQRQWQTMADSLRKEANSVRKQIEILKNMSQEQKGQ